MVLATQNPVETAGTYPLPEAQLDRFFMRISMGYPTHQEEMSILANHRPQRTAPKLQPVASAQDVIQMQQMLDGVRCAPAIMDYVVSIAEATRSWRMWRWAISPRAPSP